MRRGINLNFAGMLKSFLLFLICVLACYSTAFSQKQLTTFGIQFKPIISANIMGTGPQEKQEGDIKFTITPSGGYNFGMVIRKGFDEQFSLESGININRRNYGLSISEDSTGFVGKSDFKYMIYELPIMGLIYVKLGEQFYMNAAFGAALNFLPSDWRSYDDYFLHYSTRKSWIVPALLTNLGFEYRTKKSGFFYLGASFHRPFTKIATAGVGFREVNPPRTIKEKAFFDISGNYLTVDLRYFFQESSKWKQQNKK